MLDLFGADVADRIDFRRDGIVLTAKHPWPPQTTVSAGRGAVFRSKSGEFLYATWFMEVYPPEGGFIRGEADTPEGCEEAAWVKYQLQLGCTNGAGEHEWEPRGYRNGAGFCKHCGTFTSDRFTAEDLGQFCVSCGVATMWHWEESDGGVVFHCPDHMPEKRQRPGGILGLADDEGEDVGGEQE